MKALRRELSEQLRRAFAKGKGKGKQGSLARPVVDELVCTEQLFPSKKRHLAQPAGDQETSKNATPPESSPDFDSSEATHTASSSPQPEPITPLKLEPKLAEVQTPRPSAPVVSSQLLSLGFQPHSAKPIASATSAEPSSPPADAPSPAVQSSISQSSITQKDAEPRAETPQPAAKGKGKGKGAAPAPPPAPPPKGKGAGKGDKTEKESSEKAAAPVLKGQGLFNKKIRWGELEQAEGTIFDCNKPSFKSSDLEAFKRMFKADLKGEGKAAVKRSDSALMTRAQRRTAGVKVFDMEQARTLGIAVSSLSMEEFAVTVRDLRWEDPKPRYDWISSFLSLKIGEEDWAKLRQFRDPEARASLRDLEQVVMPFALLPRGLSRLRILGLAKSISSQYCMAKQILGSVRTVCEGIQGSETLREVMCLALGLGNFINYGDAAAGAKAISINSLKTLSEFKSGGKLTSLHFLCANFQNKDSKRNVPALLSRELGIFGATGIDVRKVMFAPSIRQSLQEELGVLRKEVKEFLHEYKQQSASSSSGACSATEDSTDSGGESEEALKREMDEAERAVAAIRDFALSGSFHEVEEPRPLPIIGSPATRLRTLKLSLELIIEELREDVLQIAEQAHQTLRFCGVKVETQAKVMPVEFEGLVDNLTSFLTVFKNAWDETRKDRHYFADFFD